MSYGTMAQALGLRLCHGILPTGHYCGLNHHLNGQVSYDPPTVHFSDRPVTKADTQAFLRLVAQALDPSINDETVPWRRVYRICRLARETGESIGVRLPARSWSADRAFVLAGVAGLPNSVPLRKQAFDWARR